MIPIFIESGSLGIMLGLIAAVYRGVLAYEEPFSLWWKFGGRFEDRWFFKPVWGCGKCFAGQIAFWIYLFLHLELQKRPFADGNMPVLDVFPYLEGYSLIGHLFAVAVAIFAAIVFIRIIDK